MNAVKLNDGTTIPAIGFGLGTAMYGRECTEHLLSALNAGYRYIDAAQMYANSKSVGDALNQWSGKREDVYILTKVGRKGADATTNDPETALKTLLKEMNVDYVDMYLIHFPTVSPCVAGKTCAIVDVQFVAPLSYPEFWAKMEALVDAGLTRSIGVSNFRAEDFAQFADSCRIKPAVNQIEYHPYNWHAANMRRLRDTMDKLDVKLQAYGPLSSLHRGPGGPLDPVVKEIASKKGVTEGQVLLQWAALHGGGCAVTTSGKVERQKEQLAAFTSIPPLTADEVQATAKAGESQFSRFFPNKVWDEAEP